MTPFDSIPTRRRLIETLELLTTTPTLEAIKETNTMESGLHAHGYRNALRPTAEITFF